MQRLGSRRVEGGAPRCKLLHIDRHNFAPACFVPFAIGAMAEARVVIFGVLLDYLALFEQRRLQNSHVTRG